MKKCYFYIDDVIWVFRDIARQKPKSIFDQYFVNGRSFFDNISQLVDEFFNDYLRRPGFVEPLAAKFCNGTTVTCEGLSQWGSQNLAEQGYNSDQII